MKLIRRIFANFWWKLLSLAIAGVLWVLLVGQTDLVSSIPVALQLRHIPKELELSSDLPERVHVQVHGPAGRLTMENLNRTAVAIDLSSVDKPGERTVTLDQSMVSLPPGVHLDRIIPAQVRLTFEERVTREVAVLVRFAGAIPEGYRLANQSVLPERIRITGPRSRVENIITVQTDPLDLSSTVGNAEFRVSVYVMDPQVRCERNQMVTARVQLEKIPSN